MARRAAGGADPGARRPARTAPKLALTVQGREHFAGLPARATLARWVRTALTRDADITLRFVGSREGERLNREFRGKDYAADVLTFDYTLRDSAGAVCADIVICPPVVRMGARRRRRSYGNHLAHLVVHGTLHAQGFDHLHPAAAAAMEAREVRILALLGVGNPYVELDAQAQV